MMARRSGWIEMDFPRMRSIFESLSTISSICGDLLCQHRLRSGHAREHERLPRGVGEFRLRRMQWVGGGWTHVEKRHGVIKVWIVLALAGLDVVFAVGLALRALPGRSTGGCDEGRATSKGALRAVLTHSPLR